MPLHVQIVSQEGPVFEEPAADIVILPGSEGEMGILPHHAALLTTLNFGELRVRKGGAEESFIVYGGVAEVRPDRVIVLADTAALLTLPERELRSGLAEVIKHGIVLDAAYFDEVERDSAALVHREPATLERIVAGSCRLKASVVERDEQESELRHVLNYGHTIGHAIEAVTGYRRFAHGEAVSLGIAAEAGIAERLGLAKPGVRARQVRLLEAVGLPVRGVGEAPSLVVEALSRDKKARDGRVLFVLAPEIGAFRLVFDVPTPTILDALAEIG